MTQPLSGVDYNRSFNIYNGTDCKDAVITDDSEFNSVCGIVKTVLSDNTNIFLTVRSHSIDGLKGKNLEDLYNENLLIGYTVDRDNDGELDYSCHIDKEEGNMESVKTNDTTLITYKYDNEQNLESVSEKTKDVEGKTQIYTDDDLSGEGEKSKIPDFIRSILISMKILNYFTPESA